MAPVNKAIYPFGNLAEIRIPGALHGLGTPLLAVSLWDTSRTPWSQVGAAAEVDPATYDVRVTTAQPMSGVVILMG